jgi:predicted permease
MENIFIDIHHGLQRLRRTPAFTMTALVTLALGIGATTAIFTLTYQVILRPLSVDHPEQLYKVGKRIDCCVINGLQNDWSLFSYDLYRHLRTSTPGIEGLAAVQAGSTIVSARITSESSAQALKVRFVSGNYFHVMGVVPFSGRLLNVDDETEEAHAVAVISHAVWKTKFNGDPKLVGATVTLTGHPVTIVGITPEHFFGERNDADPSGVWLPIAQESTFDPIRRLNHAPNVHWLDLVVRIRDPKNIGPIEMAMRAELVDWIRKHHGDFAGGNTQISQQTTELFPVSEGMNILRNEYEKSLRRLQLAAAFVLIISCANLANILLARGVARRREFSIRSSLGATRPRLVREMLVESMILSICGGMLGILLAHAGVRAILAAIKVGIPIDPVNPSLTLSTLLFAFSISTISCLIFGLAPALIISRIEPAEVLRGDSGVVGNIGGFQRALIVLQAALSVVLINTAGLLILSLRGLESDGALRFNPRGSIIVFIDLPAAAYHFEQLQDLYRQFDEAFASTHNLHDAAYATYSPMSYNNWSMKIAIDDGNPNTEQTASYSSVSPHFFKAVGTRVLQGRTFTDDDTEGRRHVAVVNRTFAQKYFPGRQPLGAYFGPNRRMNTEFEIVGIVDDSKYGDPMLPTRPMFFTPLSQTVNFLGDSSGGLLGRATLNEQLKHFASNVVVRYDGDAGAATTAVRRALRKVNPDIPIRYIAPYDEQVGNYFTRQNLVVCITAIFSMLCLILATIGFYGVTAYAVTRRIPEIGLRMALGADRTSVLRLILGQASMQTGIGLTFGIPACLLAEHFLRSQLYEVKGGDFRSLFTACGALLFSTFVANIIPARRASTVEPMKALRNE